MTIKAQLEKLSTEREDALAKVKDLLATAEKDGLSDKLTAQIDELTATAETADGAIQELLDRDKAIQAKLEKIGSFADHTAAINGARGVHVPEKPTSGEQPKNTIPATVRRYSELQNFRGGDNPEERAYRFGQFALAKLTMDMPGQFGGRFQHARQFASDQFGLPTMVHSEGSGNSNSHIFVPEEFGMDIQRLRLAYGVARQTFLIRQMSSDTRTDPRDLGDLEAYFVGENSPGTESDAEYDDVRLTAKKLMVLSRMSSELDEDSVINFGDELAGKISYAFAKKEDQCAFVGDGTSTYGGMLGLLTRMATLTAGTAPGLVAGAGNLWSELTLANFNTAVAALPDYAEGPSEPEWLCNKTFFYSVMYPLAQAAGGTTSDMITTGASRRVFLGYPVRFSNAFPSTEANSQIPVTLGQYRQAASLGDRRMETITFSDQATVGGQSLWERDQIAVKGTERFDINVHTIGSNTAAGPVVGIKTAAS